MSKIRKQIESDIKGSYMGYGDFRDYTAVDLLEESFKKNTVLFSLFLRENYSTYDPNYHYENYDLSAELWQDENTGKVLNINEIYKIWENEK